MPFFLLGKGPENRLMLLSETAVASRKAALAELSRITADPSFANWDDEVVVMDLDKGTPVLLMRPAAAEPVASEEEAAVEEEPAAEPKGEQAPDDAAVFEAPEIEPVMAEPSGTDAGEEPVVEVDGAWAEAVEDTVVEAEEDISLKDALLRTASKMESEGISAPESVGPVEPASEEATEPAEGEAAPAEAAAWPWDTAHAEGEAEDVGFELEALEEPGRDDADAGLVRAAGDDETMAASRPVIMGAYDEVEPAAAVEEATQEPPVDADASPEQPPEEAAPSPADAEMSDFILDLEQSAPSDLMPGYDVSQVRQPQMTCEECIYENTCPHKAEGPASCGSFQWK